MATNTLATNIGQAVSDFRGIKEALTEKSIPVPPGTKTEQYGDMVRSLYSKQYIDDIVEAARRALLKSNIEGGEIGAESSAFTGKVENGENLFRSSPAMRRFTADLSSLKNGRYMFSSTMLQKFIVELPELEDGTYMFNYTRPIGSFSIPGGFPKLRIGDNMFAYNAPDVFEYPMLESGINMFAHLTHLTAEQIVSILNSLPDRTGLSQATLTLNQTNKAKLTADQIAIGTNKNWDIAD